MKVYVDIKKKLDEFNLNVKFQGKDTIGLLGGSGCGKSMTLKSIAGIVEPDSGVIKINDRVVFDSNKSINLPPQERNVGFVFQNYALFPHMNVAKNIGFSVQSKYSKKELKKKVSTLAKNMEILALLDRYPDQLSGGQQQRVALARVLITEPEILLLDEPFSALDSYLKMNLQEWLEILIKNFHGPVIFVSHNIDEVSRFCDSIIVLDNGKIIEVGNTQKVLHDPESIEAAILSGCENISPISHIEGTSARATDWDIVFNLNKAIPQDSKYFGFHGVDLSISKDSTSGFNCKIQEIWKGVNLVRLKLLAPSGKASIQMEISRKDFKDLSLSDSINVHIHPSDIKILK